MKKLTIGSRGSVLALWQANFIKESLKKQYDHLEIEIQVVKTKGDKILEVPLAKIGGKGLFTKELEELLLKGEIDLAVHSLKDVPIEMPEGLEIGAICAREDPRDAFVSAHYVSLEDLPLGARVGTTSLRRSMQLKVIREDLDTQSLRGNVQTRLQRLKEGSFEAIVLAQAGLNRLGISPLDFHIVPLNLIAAMGQGALGLQCAKGSWVSECVGFLNDKKTVLECLCERSFIEVLEGGCQVPIGAEATLNDEVLYFRVILGLPSGQEILTDKGSVVIKNALLERDFSQCVTLAKELGKTLANGLIARGAKEILQKVTLSS